MIMKLIIAYVLVLFISLPIYANTDEAILTRKRYGTEAYRFQYIGRDDFGGDWYLDKQEVYVDDDIVDFYVEATITLSYRQYVVNWLKRQLNNQPQAYEILNKTEKIFHQYIWDVEQSLFCMKNIFLYDAHQELLYHQSFSAFEGWYPVSSNSIIKRAIEWIDRNIISTQDNESVVIDIEPPQRIPKTEVQSNASSITQKQNSSTTNNAFSVVMIALMLGALVSTLLVLFYIDFTSSSSSKQSTHAETTPNEQINTEHEETAFAEEKIRDDFDYPYEDIGKITGI